MAKFRRKPMVIEAITFEEFVAYTRLISKPPHWSFRYKGKMVTHESDTCYQILTNKGIRNITPQDMLVTDESGEVYPLQISDFENNYEPVEAGTLRELTDFSKNNLQ